MKRQDYINGLANSPLPKSLYDKEVQHIPDEPEYVTEYAFSVLRGFKWSEKYFKEKYNLNEESNNIRQEIKTLKINTDATIESHFWEVKNTIQNIQELISENNYDLSDYKELVNKRINDTNDKIEKKTIPILESIEKTKIDFKQEISTIRKDIDNKTVDIISLKDEIYTKAPKEHKHNIKDIQGIESITDSVNKEIKRIDKELEDKATFEEVKTALDKFYTKKEVYSKKEINDKLEDIKPRGSTIVTWIWNWGWWSSSPTYIPFILLTNAERDALTPSIWYTVYCTDEIEWLYIYTSDGRQRLQMIIIS